MSEKTYERTWLPADWLDECIPATLRHPTDFLHKREDGSYIVTPKEGKDDLEPEGGAEDQERMLLEVSPGDIVRFQPTEQYGRFTLRIHDDLSHSVDGDYPAKASHFFLWDAEEIFESLGDAVRMGGDDSGHLAPGKYGILIYWWGNDVAFRFEIGPDGAGRFVEVGGVQ